MSSNDLAISAQGLGKLYHLYNRPQDRLKQQLFSRFGRHYGTPFWALRDISFEIRRGETFGVIGRNGSGKSTLLQILAGILQPAEGWVQVNGRVAALLELGSGFNPEYTGRENILLNGAILGISPRQMAQQIDQIIAFADIGPYIDQPVKLYSSGMFVRLAFSVAAGVDADILLIDEALAVGDVFFRQKCYQRLEALRQNGASIILVSHAMNEVEQFCGRALLLDAGHMIYSGSAVEAVKRYYIYEQTGHLPKERETIVHEDSAEVDLTSQEGFWPPAASFLDISSLPEVSNGWASFTATAICDSSGLPCSVFQQGETAHFFFEVIINNDIEVPIAGVELVNEKGTIVHGKNSLLYGTEVPTSVRAGSRLRFKQEISLDLACGEYSYNVGLTTISLRSYQRRGLVSNSTLDSWITVLANRPQAGRLTIVNRVNASPTQLLHFGVADLPGRIQVNLVKPGEDHG